MNNIKEPLIDITITATLRPEILFRTLHSFYDRCFQPIAKECRVIINVDPVGHQNVDAKSMLNIVSSFFPHYKIFFPLEASFPKAFVWCWKNTTAPWIFHLEEDWELLQNVDIEEMIRTMNKFPQLALLRLPYNRSEAKTQKNWSHFYQWNGHFYECPTERKLELGFCGHPSLIRSNFVRRTWPHIDDRHNPEKQFHHGHANILLTVLDHEFGNWGKPGDGPYIRDIGRQWMVENGFAKKGNKSHFTEWEKTT